VDGEVLTRARAGDCNEVTLARQPVRGNPEPSADPCPLLRLAVGVGDRLRVAARRGKTLRSSQSSSASCHTYPDGENNLADEVLGLKEGVFRRARNPQALLTERRPAALQGHGSALGPDLRDRLAPERYLGTSPGTRASQNLAVTYVAPRCGRQNMLNPSPFASHLQRLLPELRKKNSMAVRIGVKRSTSANSVVPVW